MRECCGGPRHIRTMTGEVIYSQETRADKKNSKVKPTEKGKDSMWDRQKSSSHSKVDSSRAGNFYPSGITSKENEVNEYAIQNHGIIPTKNAFTVFGRNYNILPMRKYQTLPSRKLSAAMTMNYGTLPARNLREKESNLRNSLKQRNSSRTSESSLSSRPSIFSQPSLVSSTSSRSRSSSRSLEKTSDSSEPQTYSRKSPDLSQVWSDESPKISLSSTSQMNSLSSTSQISSPRSTGQMCSPRPTRRISLRSLRTPKINSWDSYGSSCRLFIPGAGNRKGQENIMDVKKKQENTFPLRKNPEVLRPTKTETAFLSTNFLRKQTNSTYQL